MPGSSCTFRLQHGYVRGLRVGVRGLVARPVGSVEVITGSMFSGKTEELIRRIKRANRTDTACAVQTCRPKSFLTDAVGSHHAQAADDHPAHAREPLCRITFLVAEPPWEQVPGSLPRGKEPSLNYSA